MFNSKNCQSFLILHFFNKKKFRAGGSLFKSIHKELTAQVLSAACSKTVVFLLKHK